MIRIAAVGDPHVGTDSAGRLRRMLDGVAERADLLLLAGDLTHRGSLEEAKVVAEDLHNLNIPVVAVLGNHDYHADEQEAVTETLTAAGVHVLEGDSAVLEVQGRRVGVAGTKGFGGGFPGRSGSDFGEPEMKAFMRHSKALATRLERALDRLARTVDLRVALTHYAPVADTLKGEPLEIYPFLGSYFLAEAIDRAGADLALHGHAHRGAHAGLTPGGIPVRNVALPVIGYGYEIFAFER